MILRIREQDPTLRSCKGRKTIQRSSPPASNSVSMEVKKRLATRQGRIMKAKRQSTAEPVFGTFTQFLGLRKINTRGIANANKVMLMSAMAYNLKKYLKFIEKPVREMGEGVAEQFLRMLGRSGLQAMRYPSPGSWMG
jgi:hypothetical protein